MYHNKYWSVKKELLIKTSFLDHRHELPEIYLEPAEHLPWGFFCENSQQLLAAVNQFKKKQQQQNHIKTTPLDIFDCVLKTHLAYLISKRSAYLSLRKSINLLLIS